MLTLKDQEVENTVADGNCRKNQNSATVATMAITPLNSGLKHGF